MTFAEDYRPMRTDWTETAFKL